MSNKTNRLLKKKPKVIQTAKIAKSSKIDQAISNVVFMRYVKEGGSIILSAIAVFFFISLASYHPFDPGWSRTAQHLQISNIAGNIGAWFADLLLYFFGAAAYLVPIMIIYSCCLMLFNKKVINNLILWNIKFVGFIITVLSTSSLISLFYSHKIIKFSLLMPISLGGVLGDVFSDYLVKNANFWGAFLILLPCLLAGITAITGVSWVNLIKIFYLIIKKILINIINIIKIINNINIKIINYIKNFIKIKIIQKIAEINKKQGAVKKQLSVTNISAPNKPLDLQSEIKPEIKQELKPELKLDQQTPYSLARDFIKQINNNKPNNKINNKTNIINKNFTKIINKNVNLPSINLLEQSTNENLERYSENSENLPDPANIQAKLADFGVFVTITNIFPGPVVTRVEMELAPGTKASKITGLSKDLARSLSVTSVRVVEVIPGKSVVGLEIPNKNRILVRLRDILSSEQYLTSSSPLTLALGKDISGIPVVADLSRMPHLLVAGTTGSGKSVGVNTMLLSILFKVTPEDVRLILIDPKMLELSIYEGIPHLLTPVVTDMKDAANVLNWCVFEMERRYKLMANVGVRNLLSFNHKVQSATSAGNPIKDPFYNINMPVDSQNKQHLDKLPHIVVIIDEFADMMMVVGKKVEEQIARIAQKARAAGIHMILATQRPSVDVITGLIKANIPTRIAFQVSSRIDSRTILDQQGAEQLLGNGDLLYLPPGTGIPVRIHGAFVSDDEVHKVVAALKEIHPNIENNHFTININQIQNLPDATQSMEESNEDALYDEAVAIVTSSRKASISYLQRRLKIGFNRSANLIEEMQRQGIVSDLQHNGIREVLVEAPPGGKY